MARDVFISYSQPDRGCAFELMDHLEAAGFTVWIAPRDVSPAAEWAEEIIDAISSARIMVLVFSSSSNESAQVRREVERAVHKGLRVLPFRIEDVLPSRSLEYFLSSQHWLDGFPCPRAPHYERLCSALRQWLRDTPTQSQADASVPPPGTPSARVAIAPDTAAIGSAQGRCSASEVRELQTRLARIVGPIANILITRAAAVAADPLELERRVAAELDSPEDRRRFLESRQ